MDILEENRGDVLLLEQHFREISPNQRKTDAFKLMGGLYLSKILKAPTKTHKEEIS